VQGEGKFEVTQSKHRLSEEQKHDDGQKLFDFCAECLKNFINTTLRDDKGLTLKDGEKLPLGFTVGLSFHRADAFTNTKDSSHTLARKISPLVCREESKQYAADKSELIMASSSGGPKASALPIQKDVMWPKCSAVLWRNMYVHLLDVLIYNTLGLISFISGRNSLLNWKHSSMIPPER